MSKFEQDEQDEKFRELLKLGFTAKFAKMLSEIDESLLDVDVSQEVMDRVMKKIEPLLPVKNAVWEYRVIHKDPEAKYNEGKDIRTVVEELMNLMVKQGWDYVDMKILPAKDYLVIFRKPHICRCTKSSKPVKKDLPPQRMLGF